MMQNEYFHPPPAQKTEMMMHGRSFTCEMPKCRPLKLKSKMIEAAVFVAILRLMHLNSAHFWCACPQKCSVSWQKSHPTCMQSSFIDLEVHSPPS